MTQANPQQLDYAKALATRAGLTIERAAHEAFGRDVPLERMSTRQASMLIAKLKGVLGEPARTGDADPAPAPADTSAISRLLNPRRIASARQLRAIHAGTAPRPDALDADAAWVLERLALADRLEQEQQRARGEGINGRGPIEMDSLVRHFGDWDRLAETFGVTVPTAKAWGKHLPAARAYEAEVKTGGWVKAPR